MERPAGRPHQANSVLRLWPCLGRRVGRFQLGAEFKCTGQAPSSPAQCGGELGLLSLFPPVWQRVEYFQRGGTEPLRLGASTIRGRALLQGWRHACFPGALPLQGSSVLPGPLRFHRARERPAPLATPLGIQSRSPTAALRSPCPPWPPVTTGLLRPSEDRARPSTFRFFTRRQPPGSSITSSERASRGLSVVFSRPPALGVGPPPHARSRLQAQGRAASLSRGRQPGPGTVRPQRRPGRFQGRPPIPHSPLGTGLPGDGAHSLRICVGPSGARGLSVRHLRIVGHAPSKTKVIVFGGPCKH
ncbi:hypothetical protein NDU88_005389 [Pleurodeles waltl]|uniref:Uncharacterized protein n=1 Tax=Pleurodeles waltl TaxID=8319 RepID=A0AAV7MGR0_PLEWA|nr:hypothetical protein NDU88_005389 [Pleurodeles waltl]